jgi:tetrahydromethanopterin S-methyltransferase subunit A
MTSVEQTQALDEILSGIDLAKCQQCGCMRETLDQISQVLPQLPGGEGEVFRSGIPDWLAKMKPVRYSCLGCEHCFAGAAQNAFTSTYPQVADSFGLSCEIQVTAGAWPPVVGEYAVLDADAPVAVVTLGSLNLPKHIADQRPTGLAITGKLETENIGIDKLIKNTIANPHLRYLILAGIESAGHQSGQTLLALAENGIDPNGRVIGSTGKRPVLRNVTREEVETFRQQIQVVDLIGCEDIDRITSLVQELAQQSIEKPLEITPCGCAGDT